MPRRSTPPSRLLDESARDEAGLALTVPSDGGVGALRTVLDRLDAANLEVDDLSIHTPDLDDVFFALTGRVDTKGTAVMTTITAQRPTAPGTRRQSHVVADAITMLRRNLLHIVRYPGLSIFTIVAPVVILLLFVFVFGGTLGAGLPGVDPAGGREAYLAYVMPGILAITIAGTAGGAATTVVDGHDRGHHRAVPHHGDLAGGGARRARARQHHPGDHRRRRSCSASACWSGSARPRDRSSGSPPSA